MPLKLVTYNSQNYASTLGSGLADCYVENYKTASKLYVLTYLETRMIVENLSRCLEQTFPQGRDDAKKPELHTYI